MFVYENGNSLNVTFKGNRPVDNPEVIVKGYVDGATLTVNGTVYGIGSEEFENKAKTFVFQKDGKLNITFKGNEGIENPEVTLDETSVGVVTAVVCGKTITLNYDAEGVTVVGSEEPTSVEPEVPAQEPAVEPEVEDEDIPQEEVEAE